MADDPYLAREAEKYSEPIPSREFILSHLAQRRTPVGREVLSQELGLGSETQQEALRRRLRAMERDGQLVFTRRQCYALPERLEMVRGQVLGHRDGYGFLRVEGKREDLFLSVPQMRRVVHGDLVLAQPTGVDRRGRREARVVRVLEPRQGLIVGRYFLEAGLGSVTPDDQRLNFSIAIAPDNKVHVRAGQVVVVALLQRPADRRQAVGSIVEVLGDNLAPGIEVEIAIRNYDIPHCWPEAVEAQIAGLSEQISVADCTGRIDLRHLSLVTIDGEDSRDFDDAVYAERYRRGWRLWVAIADVSHYVPVNTPLDEAAQQRGNSVYFPSRVIPMLPEVLSQGVCSLNPLVDRLCLVCEMTLSAHGKLTAFEFYEAVMNSKARLTYTQVANILQGDSALCQRYASLVPALQALHQLYKILKSARERRGGIEFETQETQFIFNDQRRIACIVPLVRNDAHKIIEECMVLANLTAAQWVQEQQVSVLYRVHDAPNAERLTALRSFLHELGLSLTGGAKPSPREYATLMSQIGGRPDSELIQTMLLRSMQPAIYTPENRGHFGLALEAYAHFTSPIRRYPDLTLHRVLKRLLAKQRLDNLLTPSVASAHHAGSNDLVQLGEHCSMTERRADEATREVADWLKCEFMQDHVGALFRGVIASVTSFGFFVRLDELFIDGLVHVTTLDNDYYRFDAVSQRLIGETLGHIYQLGDVVQVKVMAVHLDQRKIDFSLISSGHQVQRATRKRKKVHIGEENPRKKAVQASALDQEKLLANTTKRKRRRSQKPRSKVTAVTDKSTGASKKNGKVKERPDGVASER